MTEATQETATTTEAPSIENVASFDERLAMIHEQVRTEKNKSSDSDSDAPIEAKGPKTKADAKVDAKEPADATANGVAVQPSQEQLELERIRAERHANLIRLKEAERAADEKRRLRARPQAATPSAAEAAEIDNLKAKLASYESAFKDEASFIAAARERGLSPTKFGEILKETLANPEYLAEHKVKNVTSAYEQKLLEAERRIDQKVAEFHARQAAAEQEAENQAAARELIEHTSASARTAPLTAAFLDKYGPAAFVDFATQIANTLPVGCGLDRVHDAIEVSLEHLQLGGSIQTAAQTPTASRTKPPDAGAKAKTVTNQLASSRTTVPDDDIDWGNLSFEERLKRLKK